MLTSIWFSTETFNHHALVYLTDKIRNETDKGSYASGVFADFSKTFDIVDRHMLSKN